MTSTLKVQNIQYTDGDAALTIADGGGVTAASTLTATGGLTASSKSTVNIASSGNAIDFKLSDTTVGNIGVISDRVYLTAEGSHGVYLDASANNFCPSSTTGTDNDGNIDLGASFARWKDAYLSGGIHLGGTGSANKLEDYEEGEWNPIIYGTTTGDSTAASRIDTFSTKKYCKIGSLVFCAWYCVGQSTSTQMTGNLTMGGLPFASNGNYVSSGSVHYNMGTPYNESAGYFFRGPNAGNTVITFLNGRDNNTWASIDAADAIPNSTSIYFQGTITYLTNS